ncbi:MAG: tetratricopeptide repeat protein [Flammeovirgaceae bacterium]|nr:MAG: tetratricopeptide repeat protein [Flammeovirgaceae bacterium]
MKPVAVLLFLAVVITDPAKIGKINRTKEKARSAYLSGDYKTAAALYQYLTDSLGVQEDEVLLNLAHARFQLNDTTRAKTTYQQLTASATPSIRSTAQQQLGVMANRAGKAEEALNFFKEALKANTDNNDARYNYELLKKKLDEQKKQEQQQQQNQNQQQKDQQQDQKKQEKQDKKKDQDNQQKQDHQKSDQQKKDEQKKQGEQKQEEQSAEEKKDNEKKEAPSSVSEKLEQLKISEEKAKMLLEAMKNQEMQYLQQNKRKPTKPKDKGKPDW